MGQFHLRRKLERERDKVLPFDYSVLVPIVFSKHKIMIEIKSDCG